MSSNSKANFTLTYQGQTYPMTYSYLPSKLEFPSPTTYQKGTGTVVVETGKYAGTYKNVPVYEYNKELWVWPDLNFSGYTAMTTGGKVASTLAQASKTPITEIVGMGALAVITVSAVVVLALRSRHKMRDQIRSGFRRGNLR